MGDLPKISKTYNVKINGKEISITPKMLIKKNNVLLENFKSQFYIKETEILKCLSNWETLKSKNKFAIDTDYFVICKINGKEVFDPETYNYLVFARGEDIGSWISTNSSVRCFLSVS